MWNTPYPPYFDPRAMNNQQAPMYIPIPSGTSSSDVDKFMKFVDKQRRREERKELTKKPPDAKKNFGLAELMLLLTISFPITAPLYVLFIRSLLRPLLIP